ncbi:Lipid A biosynthesis lauroyltransferase [Sporomusa carbonis]|uniref:lysophospholipid acyltransferase family protein n=1 Tax=Sporomusa carbonis TaxID=3076075 RepID=UPI003A6119BF
MQYFLLKTLSRLICLLPYSLVCRIGRGLGFLHYLIAKRQRERGIAQAMSGLGISRGEAQGLIRRLFGNLGQTLMEVMYTPALTPDNIGQYVSIEGLDNLREGLKSGHGVVFLTAHMGNWEWMGAALAFAGFPMTTIVKPQPNAQYTRILNEYRKLVGLEVFNRGTNEIVKAARALKNGKVLGFLADQDGGADGVFVDFLGKKASTPAGPAIFAKKFEAVIVPGYTYHRPGGGHHVVIESPLVYERCEDPGQELYQNTARMTKIIENAIKAHPEDWLWFMKRWNTKYKGD